MIGSNETKGLLSIKMGNNLLVLLFLGDFCAYALMQVFSIVADVERQGYFFPLWFILQYAS